MNSAKRQSSHMPADRPGDWRAYLVKDLLEVDVRVMAMPPHVLFGRATHGLSVAGRRERARGDEKALSALFALVVFLIRDRGT